jgi:AhpD family alkylhydroperoxidase
MGGLDQMKLSYRRLSTRPPTVWTSEGRREKGGMRNGSIVMTARLDPAELSASLYKKYLAFSMATADSAIEQGLRDLVHIRASQINGCAFCLDMHVKEATIHGERPLRLHHLAVWRESPLFTGRERAALNWTEALTRLGEHGVSDATYAETLEALNPQEISDLTMVVMEINGWNRLSIAFRAAPGSKDADYGLTKAGLS